MLSSGGKGRRRRGGNSGREVELARRRASARGIQRERVGLGDEIEASEGKTEGGERGAEGGEEEGKTRVWGEGRGRVCVGGRAHGRRREKIG